jgi:tRNA U34 5-methylaminomethyl-2-thiouridine-forming methyltransferase MnmC
MITPEIVKTADGSDTLFVNALGEHYHSTHGAIQESKHIFIEAGLQKCEQSSIVIFEIGFGTGLNAYLTLLETIKTKKQVRYYTVEKYPLSPAIWTTLNYPEILPFDDGSLFRQLHESEWNKEVKITEYFSIFKLPAGLSEVSFSSLPLFNLIYFDAFSPEKQPDLWEATVFIRIANHCQPGAILTTYCAKGVVRRSLKEAGFITERIPGPPGKREIIRGTIINEI